MKSATVAVPGFQENTLARKASDLLPGNGDSFIPTWASSAAIYIGSAWSDWWKTAKGLRNRIRSSDSDRNWAVTRAAANRISRGDVSDHTLKDIGLSRTQVLFDHSTCIIHGPTAEIQ